jgi:hypothetical protein
MESRQQDDIFQFEGSVTEPIVSNESDPDSEPDSDPELPEKDSVEKFGSPLDIAKADVREVGPRVYVLTGHDKEEICLDVFGCQGEEGPHQKEVAELLNKKAAKKKADLMVVLGDNFYSDGVPSPDDPRFKSQIYDVYADKKLEHICDVPMAVILGNHDANRYLIRSYKSAGNYALGLFPFIGSALADKYLPSKPVGEETEINQAAHTYLPREGDPQIDETYVEFFQRDQLPIKSLRKFNMPFFYYSFIIGNVQLFFLNTNNYAKHYYDSLNGTNNDPLLNQALWLKAHYDAARAAGRTVLFAQHHPLITCDKRAFAGDAYLYFDPPSYRTPPADWVALAGIFNLEVSKYSYSALLSCIYEKQGISPDLILCAHGHYLGYINNNLKTDQRYKIRQVISGAGGGKLMPQKDFSRGDILGLHEEKFGYVRITCNVNRPQFVHMDFYTTDDHHFEFTNEGIRPLDAPIPVEEKDPSLSTSVLKPGLF